MTAQHPAPPDRPTARHDIVLFFPVAALRQPVVRATLSSGGEPCCTIAIDAAAGEVTVAAGGQRRVLPVGPRAAERPAVMRLSQGGGAATCRIGMLAPMAMPALAAAFDFDAADLTRGIVLDRIAPLADDTVLLARGFQGDPGRRTAGAVDHVSRGAGVGGWIVDLDRADRPHLVELRCGATVLAQRTADQPRAPGAPLLDDAPLGRFVFAWSEVDQAALARCDPAEPIVVGVPALGMVLDNVHRPLSARVALEFIGSAASDGAARVSAVVPSWNYARYMPQRLQSLFAQAAPEASEIIVLDDASTDDSVAVAVATAAAAQREVQIVTGARNSGGVMPQWRRAAALARGEFTMIAEADDVADPALLARLSAMLSSRADMLFAFCDSTQIDGEGATLQSDHKRYYAALGDHGLEREQVFPAAAFLRRFLAPRNLVVNASAVLWRTAALRGAIARIGPALDALHATGDWRVYIEACRAGGSIGYVPDTLNHFRRHATSVIGRFTKADHLAEIERIHALLLTLHEGDAKVAAKLETHRAALRRLWNVPAADAAAVKA